MRCFVTLLTLNTPAGLETALFINRDFIVCVKAEAAAQQWLERLALEFAAMHDAEVTREVLKTTELIHHDELESHAQIQALLRGDTQAFLKAQGLAELDYIDALETVLMRNYAALSSAA